MSARLEDSVDTALDALRVAAVTGQPAALRKITAGTVAQHEDTLVPELLRLCAAMESPAALLNAAWKLLLCVASLPATSPTLHTALLRFMLTELHQHVFSHDWTDDRRAKLAAFVASHIVSAARSQPLRMASVLGPIAELLAAVSAAIAANAQADAARRLHKAVAVRLHAVLAAAGAGGALPDILMHCVPMPAAPAAPSAFSEFSACVEDSSLAVAAVAAFAAMTTGLRAALAANAPLGFAPEEMLRAALLWLPAMRHVVPPRPHETVSAEAESLQRRVAAHAAALPAAVFFADTSEEGEMPLDAQLLLALRTLATRCAALSVPMTTACGPSETGVRPLLRRPVFGVLLAALLVPCDASAARVLIVWDAALRGMPRHSLAALATEVCRLGQDQCNALAHTPHHTQANWDNAAQLRRFLQTLAVLVAAVCHRIQRSPSALRAALHSPSPAGQIGSQGNVFVCLADCMYAQICAYQWWADTTQSEARCDVEKLETSASEETVEAAAVGNGDRNDAAAQCAALVALPARIAYCARRPVNDCFISTLRFATRVVQSALTAEPTVAGDHDVTACARFVAAELVAAVSLVPSGDTAFLACVRRLVDLSFDGAGDGLSRFHAAVCLRGFVQRNTSVPLASLCLSEEAAAALMQLLRASDSAGDNERESEAGGGIAAAECARLWERHAKAFCPHLLDEEPPCETSTGVFMAQLREAESTLEALLQWSTDGKALQPAEVNAIGRLARLVGALTSEDKEQAQARDVIKTEPEKSCGGHDEGTEGPEVFLVD